MPVRKLPSFLLNILYPNRCDCCGTRIAYDAAICAECAAELETLRASADAWYRAQKDADYPWDGLCCVYAYTGIAKRGVLAMKDGRRGFCRYAAKQLAETVRQMPIPASIDCVTWVPMTKQRRRIQGYAHTELLGRALAAELGCAARSDLLWECSGKLRQHQLPAAERAVYAKLRFQHTDTDLSGQTVLLADDILTTGSTMRRCTELLRETGAKRIIAAAAACRLPEPTKAKEETANAE